MNFEYEKHLILLALAGSRSYGTHRPDSDYDYRGVIIPPPEFARGFLHRFEQKEGLKGYGKDSVGYDIRKFAKLAADCNPNITESLFVDEKLLVVNTKYGKRLRENRELFLSKKAKHTFSGYAFAQLKRIKQHKAWWDKEQAGLVPPKPERKDFGLDPKPLYGKGALNNLITTPTAMIHPDHLDYVSKERQYQEAKRKYDSWADWQKNRNPARYILEKNFGYDSKHAMHLVRLMTMCEEILTTGEVIVTRPDAKFLLSIRDGAWTYEQLIAWADEMEAKLDELYHSSDLPHKPDLEKINNLCVELVEEAERDGFPNS